MKKDFTMNEYQDNALRTSKAVASFETRLITAALGLTGEAGEFANLVKKMTAHGHDWDKEKLADELGDILWYITEAAETLDMSLEEVALLNNDKLNKRYPEGFSENASRNRKN